MYDALHNKLDKVHVIGQLWFYFANSFNHMLQTV